MTMRETAIYPLRLPKSLKEAVAKAAKRDATSVIYRHRRRRKTFRTGNRTIFYRAR